MMNYSVSQRAAAELELRRRRRERAAQSGHKSVAFTDFKRALYPRYEHAPHLEAIDRLLTEVTRYTETGGREGIGRAIVEMPPRHGKSVSISRLYPAWHLGRNPDHRIMLVSYGATLAEKHSRAARNFMRSPRYREFFPTALAADSQAADSWNVANGDGGMDALGIGGGATGKGAHLLLIDDPVKNREEAESELIREKIWDAYGDDLYTRLEPGGAIVVVMTRWHMDDLVGRLLTQNTDDWHVLCLPGLAEANDPIGRAEGDALWPQRYPSERLHAIRATLGEYGFSALYAQRPIPAAGGLFKREKFNVIDVPPSDIVRRVRAWDLAMSDKTSADFTVGALFGVTSTQHVVVLDIVRAQVDWDAVPDLIERVALADGHSVSVVMERAFIQARAVQKVIEKPNLHHHVIRGYQPDTDKLTRALPFAARVGEGMVSVLRRHWTEAYIDELCSFPRAAHDDQVDASSIAYAGLDKQPFVAKTSNYA